jgi:hypothetical protein
VGESAVSAFGDLVGRRSPDEVERNMDMGGGVGASVWPRVVRLVWIRPLESRRFAVKGIAIANEKKLYWRILCFITLHTH